MPGLTISNRAAPFFDIRRLPLIRCSPGKEGEGRPVTVNIGNIRRFDLAFARAFGHRRPRWGAGLACAPVFFGRQPEGRATGVRQRSANSET